MRAASASGGASSVARSRRCLRLAARRLAISLALRRRARRSRQTPALASDTITSRARTPRRRAKRSRTLGVRTRRRARPPSESESDPSSRENALSRRSSSDASSSDKNAHRSASASGSSPRPLARGPHLGVSLHRAGASRYTLAPNPTRRSASPGPRDVPVFSAPASSAPSPFQDASRAFGPRLKASSSPPRASIIRLASSPRTSASSQSAHSASALSAGGVSFE